jgi:DNA segregation ATPase FtsK/SpoIIIE-like protein
MSSKRVNDFDDAFVVPDDIRVRAAEETARGVRVYVTPSDLIGLMDDADKALNGDSNDAEHDALYDLRDTLSEWFEDPALRKIR